MLLINRIFSNNITTWVFSLIMIAFAIFLQIFYKKQNWKGKKLTVLRSLCFAPLAIALIHFSFFSFKHSFWLNKYYYGLFYISCAAPFIPAFFSIPFFKNRFPRAQKILLKIFIPLTTTFVILANLHTIIMPFVWDSAMRNHTRDSYTESFIKTTKDMEKYYSLKEWKKIDIPALREKFLPLVQKAEQTKDAGLFSAAMTAYTYNFYDGHVSTYVIDDKAWERCILLFSGHDYGMSMIKLQDGRTVAVNVLRDGKAWQNGIRNQTVITSWNGQKINDAIENTEFIFPGITLPVKTTEDFYKPIMLATKGMHQNGERGIISDLLVNAAVTEDSQRPHAFVGFIDENGNEKQLELEAIGNGNTRFENTFILLVSKLYSAFPDMKNLQTAMLNSDTAIMQRYNEQSNTFYDILSYFTNRNLKVKRQLIEELTARKNEGMKKLIIDARNNTGGFWALGVETASLFSNKSFEIAKRGTEVFGKKNILQTVTVPADGRFSDIEVILLVNSYCVSAGDSLVKMLSECPNVTVMGLTPSNCSCQETGGVSFLTDSICDIVYPVNWLYEIDDDLRYIDTNETRECTLPLDVQIPLTWDLIQDILINWETRDIVLEYAVDYLK